MEQKNCKLKNFDYLYNKFIFEWSQGKDLQDIVTDLNNIKNNNQYQYDTDQNQYNNQQEYNNQQNYDTTKDEYENTCTDEDECTDENYIKDEFFKLFPTFLLHKCQSKFPIDDTIDIPTDIIQDFWNNYKEQILAGLLNVSKSIIISALTSLFETLFGKQDEYNQDIFNPYAMRLVSMME